MKKNILVVAVLALFAGAAQAGGDVYYVGASVGVNQESAQTSHNSNIWGTGATSTPAAAAPVAATSTWGFPGVSSNSPGSQTKVNLEFTGGTAWLLPAYGSGVASIAPTMAGLQGSLFLVNGKPIVATQGTLVFALGADVTAPSVQIRSGYSNSGFVAGADLMFHIRSDAASADVLKISVTEFSRDVQGAHNLLAIGAVRYFK